MKFLKYLSINIMVLLLAPSNFIIAMEEGARTFVNNNYKYEDVKVVPKIPSGVAHELAKAGINVTAKTEKDIFAVTDKFMKADSKTGKPVSPESARTVINLVKLTGREKGLTNYNYGDFKADIMDDIIDARARLEAWKKAVENNKDLLTGFDEEFWSEIPEKKLNWQKQFGYPENKLDVALKAEAYIWAKAQLVNDRKFKEKLQGKFIKAFNDKNTNLNSLEILLKFGADPDKLYFDNSSSSIDIINTLINKNFDKSFEYFQKNINYKDVINIINLLIKYGANLKLRNSIGETSLESAKRILKDHLGKFSYITGYKDEKDEKAKALKQIIKILEDAEKNQIKSKKQNNNIKSGKEE